jgi:hypothetical protein
LLIDRVNTLYEKTIDVSLLALYSGCGTLPYPNRFWFNYYNGRQGVEPVLDISSLVIGIIRRGLCNQEPDQRECKLCLDHRGNSGECYFDSVEVCFLEGEYVRYETTLAILSYSVYIDCCRLPGWGSMVV